MRRILFVCTGNCVRSQMAEALLRFRGGARFEACSAGVESAGFVHPMAQAALDEIDVPVGGLRSKGIETFEGQAFDAIVTLCDYARDTLAALDVADDGTPRAVSTFPPTADGRLPVRVHWSFPDPSIADVLGLQARIDEYRATRDELRDCVERLAIAPDATLDDDATFAQILNDIARALEQDDPEAGE